MKKLRATDDAVPHNEAGVALLKGLVKDALIEKREQMKADAAAGRRLTRKLSLTAVFQIRKGSVDRWKVVG